MYKLNYDFGERTNDIAIYIQTLLDSSIKNFQPQIADRKVLNIEHDSDTLVKSFHDIEEFLHYLYINSPETFSKNFDIICNGVKIIAVLIDDKRGIYSHFRDENKKIIYINPDLQRSANLTCEEQTKLYLIHEFGRVINSDWMKKVKEYVELEIKNGNLQPSTAQLIPEGFAMLDVVTAQNTAENFVYYASGKQRNDLTEQSNSNLFNGEPYKTNFEYLGELQEPAIMFARTLTEIGKEITDLESLNILSKKALSSNFFTNILEEYLKDEKLEWLISELQFMGLLKKVSQANLGFEDASYLKDSKSYLENVKSATTKMRDFRHPIYKPTRKWKLI